MRGGISFGSITRRAGGSLAVAVAVLMQPPASRSPGDHSARAGTCRPLRERDLHNGVQNELLVLIVQLSLLRRDPRASPDLALALCALEARAQAVLDSVRDLARGIYPKLLAEFGLERALRSQTARVPIDLELSGSSPRSSDEAEAAVYFSSSEAIQNVLRHAGDEARVTVQLRHAHDQGTLTVLIDDDGRGFDPDRTPRGAGLDNIRARIQSLSGSVTLRSKPGRGTTVTLVLPWPARTPAPSG
jgi:signal transduction histidine kinase